MGTTLKEKYFFKITSLCLFFSAFAINAFAATVYVDASAAGGGNGSEGSPYNTITDGVDNAEAGDTILITAGTYSTNETFPIGITKQLTIQSATNDPSTVTITGGSGEIIFNFPSGTTTGSAIQGLTIVISGSNSYGISASGGTSDDLYINNNIIYADDVSQGGIYIANSSSGHTISNNRIYDIRYGIVTANGVTSANIFQNTIYSCVVAAIGTANASDDITVYSNIIKGCEIGLNGGTGSITSNFNCIHGNTTQYTGVTAGNNDIVTNPRLQDPANADFDLFTGSPCLSTGSSDGSTLDTSVNIGWYQETGEAGNTHSSNIYVSGTGNDSTGDGTESNPFRSITKGILNVLNTGTVNVLAGTYNAANGESFPIIIGANMTISGAGANDVTIVTGNIADAAIRSGDTATVTISGLSVNFSDNDGGGTVIGAFEIYGTGTVNDCIAYGNNVAVSFGFEAINGGTATFNNCIAYNLDSGFAPVATSSAASLTANNCIAYNCADATYNTGYLAASGNSSATATLVVKNSIAADCTTGIGQLIAGGSSSFDITSSYNCFNSTTEDYDTDATIADTTGDLVATDPIFIDPANANFRLQSQRKGYSNNSPCIDVGTSSGAPSTDMAGATRPQGVGIDIGAYESLSGLLASLNKSANKKKASVGQVITYTLNIRNTSGEEMLNTQVYDILPKGFKYLTGTANLNNVSIADPEGARSRTFTLGTLSSAASYILKYKTVVGSGVSYGKSKNIAHLKSSSSGVDLSSGAEETVLIVPNPIFNAATIIGKVFRDNNKNGYQDEGEVGLPNISLITEDGYLATTDRYGRYHIEGLKPQTKIVALMTNSLPKGATLTTENPVLLRFSAALTMKANFGVFIEKEPR